VTDPEHTPAEPSVESPDIRKTAEESLLRWLGELIVLVVLAFVLAMGIKTFVVQPFVIPSGSMEPTLQINDRVLVNKFVYRFWQPTQGDVVVFISPDDKSTDFIKRVIAVAGQTVDINDGVVSIDGKPLPEPYVNKLVVDHYNSDKPVRVPRGQVWLMGDNRTNSRDSRFFGPRPVSELLGKAFLVYWPLDRIGPL
jgi:signal peptidase I